MESVRPFAETLRGILESEGIGHRELARRCEARGWGSHTTINHLARGIAKPSAKAMAEIARALVIPPETFAEYRLWKARTQLDPDEVGLKKALKNLEKRG